MINDNNKLHFLLGVLVTSLSVVLFKEITHKSPVLQTKTETIVRMVDEPFLRGDFETEASEIQSTLNKSKLAISSRAADVNIILLYPEVFQVDISAE